MGRVLNSYKSSEKRPVNIAYIALGVSVLSLLMSAFGRYQSWVDSRPALQFRVWVDMHEEGEAYVRLLNSGQGIARIRSCVVNDRKHSSGTVNDIRLSIVDCVHSLFVDGAKVDDFVSYQGFERESTIGARSELNFIRVDLSETRDGVSEMEALRALVEVFD